MKTMVHNKYQYAVWLFRCLHGLHHKNWSEFCTTCPFSSAYEIDFFWPILTDLAQSDPVPSKFEGKFPNLLDDPMCSFKN